MVWRRVELPGRGPSYPVNSPATPPPNAAAPKTVPPNAPPPALGSNTPPRLAPGAAPAVPPAAPAPDLGQLEAKIREAHAAGVREGEAAGRKAATAEFQAAIDRLGHSIEEISGLRARLRREAEQDLIRLALAIAQRIIRRELAVDPEAIHGLVLGALEKLQGQEICRVRVHPSHAPQVSACLRQLAPASPVEVVPDASREPGAVIFETERGNLDASVETQLREIERGLSDRLRNSK
jgi:flagellar assembly protein FliH